MKKGPCRVFKFINIGIIYFGLIACITPLWANSPGMCGGGGDGHEVPTPFESVNQKFELADNEVYLLYGEVLFFTEWNQPVSRSEGVSRSKKVIPYFKVNLDRSPWLGNAARVRSPYYRLDGKALKWVDWVGTHLQSTNRMLFRAHSHYFFDHQGKVGSEITLELLF